MSHWDDDEDDYRYRDDNGTMPANVEELKAEVVGHRIVKAERAEVTVHSKHYNYSYSSHGFVITLDNGKQVVLRDSSDCCAYTELKDFLLHADKIDHMIVGVKAEKNYTRWRVFADFGDVLEMKVGWSAGNPFYYGYGFDIDVVEP